MFLPRLRAALAGTFVVLAGCADIAGFNAAPAPTLALYDGSVMAAVPEGYCIETRTSRPADGFAVMAACSTIAGDASRPPINGFVTVQVGEAGSGLGNDGSADLEQLLNSQAGRGLLSTSGDPATIRVQGTGQTQGVVSVRFIDSAPPRVAGLQTTEWRGFFDVDGRLATVSVRGLAAAPLGTDDGQILLQSVIRAMQQINAGSESGVDA